MNFLRPAMVRRHFWPNKNKSKINSAPSCKAPARPVRSQAARHCDLGGKNYLKEQVVEWEYCRRLTMWVVGTNLPMESVDIRFTLETEDDETVVTVSPEGERVTG